MKTLEKQFEYKNYKFNITVTLCLKSERHVGGKVLHEIRINDMGVSNFYRKEMVEDPELLDKIVELERLAKNYVDNRESETIWPLIEKLSALGFK